MAQMTFLAHETLHMSSLDPSMGKPKVMPKVCEKEGEAPPTSGDAAVSIEEAQFCMDEQLDGERNGPGVEPEVSHLAAEPGQWRKTVAPRRRSAVALASPMPMVENHSETLPGGRQWDPGDRGD